MFNYYNNLDLAVHEMNFFNTDISKTAAQINLYQVYFFPVFIYLKVFKSKVQSGSKKLFYFKGVNSTASGILYILQWKIFHFLTQKKKLSLPEHWIMKN